MRSLILGLFLLPFVVHAQHCGYDGAALIVVRPHAAADSAVIEGLRITLLDSNNVPYAPYGGPRYLFHRNTDVAGCDEPAFGTHKGQPCCFPFAADAYVLVVPRGLHTAGMQVLVQDERSEAPLNKRRDRWPVRFRQQVVPLTAFDQHRLCGTYDAAVYPPQAGQPPFAPVEVILQPR